MKFLYNFILNTENITLKKVIDMINKTIDMINKGICNCKTKLLIFFNGLKFISQPPKFIIFFI